MRATRILLMLAWTFLILPGYISAQVSRRQEIPSQVRITFVGDIMLDRTPGKMIAEGKDPFAHVAALLDDSDITIGNLECVVATSGQAIKKPYNFRADPRSIPLLAKHFDAVSLANNHTGDYGPEALVEMLERLDRGKVPYFGAGRNRHEAHASWIVEKNGLKVAVLGYNEFKPRSFEAGETTPGSSWSDDAAVVADIKAVRDKADLVLTFMHWGHEYELEPSDRQKSLARAMIDAGADAVIGGHPHVVEGFELYKDKPIAYSLGNFVFDDFKDVNESAMLEPSRRGWILTLTLAKSGLVSWRTTVTRTDDDGFPRPLPNVKGPAGSAASQALPPEKTR